jgi:hypothetical protein
MLSESERECDIYRGTGSFISAMRRRVRGLSLDFGTECVNLLLWMKKIGA